MPESTSDVAPESCHSASSSPPVGLSKDGVEAPSMAAKTLARVTRALQVQVHKGEARAPCNC